MKPDTVTIPGLQASSAAGRLNSAVEKTTRPTAGGTTEAAPAAPAASGPAPEVLARARQSLEREFAATRPGSVKLSARGELVFPGGVTHDSRRVGSTRLHVRSACGARKTDVDGHSYIDYWVGHGSLLLGHRRKEVIEAVHLAALEVTHPGACHEREILWAERAVELVPSAEKIRFTASGSEATALATRLARAFTGRPKLLKFEGHFHGWLDHAAVGYELPFELPFSRGVPEEVLAQTLVSPADLTVVDGILSKCDEVAAVILEPTGGAGGAVPLNAEFVRGLRELTRRRRVLLIFDEVITGFRVAPGGAQERFGVVPDLTCLAKILAGGLPGGAVCGPEVLFRRMEFSADRKRNRRERVAQYGTFNANPLSAAAGAAALRLVADNRPGRAAEETATLLRAALNALFKDEDLPWAAYGFSSTFHLLTAAPAAEACAVRDGRISAGELPAQILKRSSTLDPLLRLALQLEGVDLPPGKQAWLSAEHGERETGETVAAFRRAVARLRELKCL